jgi:hypothetical protein
MSYIYQADVWCDDCGRALCESLPRPTSEHFDSDEYPKPAGNHEESDSPQHCAAGEDCINAITLPSGARVGCLFGELTMDGIDYVLEAAEDPTEVTDLWLDYYEL